MVLHEDYEKSRSYPNAYFYMSLNTSKLSNETLRKFASGLIAIASVYDHGKLIYKAYVHSVNIVRIIITLTKVTKSPRFTLHILFDSEEREG